MIFFLHREKDHQSSHISSDDCFGQGRTLLPATRKGNRKASTCYDVSIPDYPFAVGINCQNPAQTKLTSQIIWVSNPDEVTDFDVPLCPVPLVSNEQIRAS